jgi:hypothetical protein
LVSHWIHCNASFLSPPASRWHPVGLLCLIITKANAHTRISSPLSIFMCLV